MVNECIEKGMQYTGKEYSKHKGRPYILKYSNELNILADFVEKCLGIRYTTSLINCHRKTQSEESLFLWVWRDMDIVFEEFLFCV